MGFATLISNTENTQGPKYIDKNIEMHINIAYYELSVASCYTEFITDWYQEFTWYNNRFMMLLFFKNYSLSELVHLQFRLNKST